MSDFDSIFVFIIAAIFVGIYIFNEARPKGSSLTSSIDVYDADLLQVSSTPDLSSSHRACDTRVRILLVFVLQVAHVLHVRVAHHVPNLQIQGICPH